MTRIRNDQGNITINTEAIQNTIREYLKNLKLLKDNQDVWKGLELYSENSVWSESENDQLLQQAISAAEKSQTFQTKNYCISGTKKEVLAFLEKGAYHRIYVDDVMFSILK